MNAAQTSEPTAGAARRKPRPVGPTSRMSLANTGKSATAPPRSTAKRSSEIAPSKTFVRRMSRTPASTSPRPAAPPETGSRPLRMARTQPRAPRASTSATTYTSSGWIANRMPPMAGPTTADPWNAIERWASALTRISSGTSDGVSDRPAGAPIALPTPCMNASTKNGQTLLAPAAVTARSPESTTRFSRSMTMSSRRLGSRSAR